MPTPSNPVPVRSPVVRTSLLLTLGLLSAIAPFATDLYLPTFPQMSLDLHTDATGVQLTLTTFLVGLGIGQLVLGPLSDRIGRRRPLLVAASVCVLAGLTTVVAPTVGVLTVARLAQGLSGAAGTVLGRAVIADLAAGPAAARAFSLMMAVVGVAPVIAPVVGSVLAESLGWRGLLGIVLALTVVMLVTAAIWVPESLPVARRTRSSLPVDVVPTKQLSSRAFLGNAVAGAFSFGAMLSYVAASPFVYQDLMGLSIPLYGALFALNALGLTGVSVLSARLSRAVPVTRMLATGLAGMLIAAITMLVLGALQTPPLLLAVPLLVLVSALGLVLGTSTTLALAAVSGRAGAGSAVFGAAQFGIGAVGSTLVGLGGVASAAPMVYTITAAVVVSCVGFVLGNPRR